MRKALFFRIIEFRHKHAVYNNTGQDTADHTALHSSNGLIEEKIILSFGVFSLQGLALINGTQMITSLGAEAVERAQAIARQADIIAALTLEVLKGTTKAFDSGEQQQ